MKVFKNIFLTAMVSLASTFAFAQATDADAINAYNEALSVAQSEDYDAAIEAFLAAIDIAKEVGNNDIIERSTNQIPKLYYRKAVSSFKRFQSVKSVDALDQAIADFETSYKKAQEYNDTEIEQRSIRVVPQLHYQKGTLFLKQEEFESADAEFDKAIEMNPNYAKAFYQKGLVHKNISDRGIEDFLNWFDKAIQIGESQNDGEVVRLSKNAAHAELLFRGANMIQENKLTEAIELLKLSLEYYAESADSYYRLAEAANKLNNYDQAIGYAEQALKYEQGGNTDKAKIYFELGLAYQMKNEKAKACNAFTNALYGSFKAPAEHKMQYELKCESTQ